MAFKLIATFGCGYFAWKISKMNGTPSTMWRVITLGWSLFFVRQAVNAYNINAIVVIALDFNFWFVVIPQIVELIAMACFLGGKAWMYFDIKRKLKPINP